MIIIHDDCFDGRFLEKYEYLKIFVCDQFFNIKKKLDFITFFSSRRHYFPFGNAFSR